jgi:hypothetical protein
MVFSSGAARRSRFFAVRHHLSRALVLRGLLLGGLLLAVAGPTEAQTPTAAAKVGGFWQAYFEDGQPSGWFYFADKGGVAEGRLVKAFKKKGDTQEHEFCDKCPGDKKGAPMLGLVIVWGMKKNGEKYENGNIIDPRDGSIYNAELSVSPDGQKLFLRGYLGISLLGQTQTWTRLPDDSIPAGQIPGLAAATPVTTPAKPAQPMAAKPAAPMAAKPTAPAPSKPVAPAEAQ